MALGIATLGSIVTGVYRGFVVPPGIPAAVARHARDSLAGGRHAAAELPAGQGEALLTAAKDAFTNGLAIASGVGSVLMLISAVAVWFCFAPRLPGEAEIGVLHDPGVHRDTGGDAALMLRVEPNWAIDTVSCAPAFVVGGDAGPPCPKTSRQVPGKVSFLHACAPGTLSTATTVKPAPAAKASRSGVGSWWHRRW